MGSVSLRALFVTTVAGTLRAFLLPIAEHLQDQGWTVEALARDTSACPELCGVFGTVYEAKWTRTPWRPMPIGEIIRDVQNIVRNGHYDVVHVHTPVAAFLTRLALKNMESSSRPVVMYTTHGLHFHPAGGRLRNGVFLCMERLSGRWTDYMVVINRIDEAAALKYRIVPPDRLHYHPGIGVDTSFYSPSSVSSRAVRMLRDELELAENDKLFSMIAAFDARKRHVDLIEALSMLKRPNVYLGLAGSGKGEKDIRALVEKLGVQDRVHFLGFRRDIPTLIRASEATVLPSIREGLPRSVMESLSLGVPVIGTNIRGIEELLEDGRGILVSPRDPRAIADAMAWILEHPTEARVMGRRARRKMMDTYDLKHILHLHDALYSEALEQRRQ
jgi:glycosyltransferase involved in cell wall biosynthesis